MSSEHERIARIDRILSRPSAELLLGIGDDCAALASSPFPQVWTVDAAVEGVHFSRTFMRDDEIGYRALMAAASDIAAMGGSARAALCALALPATLGDDALDALLQGLAAAADELGLPIAGGNLTRASELSITCTVLGECRGALITRAGARVGDGIFVSGEIGGAALGLLALRRDGARPPRHAHAIERFLRPKARLDLAPRIADLASAAIDVSDGLAQDLAHLCQASQVAARLELGRVPRAPDFEALARELGEDPARLLLGGGEDYELLFTASAADLDFAVQIGSVVAGAPGVTTLGADGAALPTAPGFDHFR